MTGHADELFVTSIAKNATIIEGMLYARLTRKYFTPLINMPTMSPNSGRSSFLFIENLTTSYRYPSIINDTMNPTTSVAIAKYMSPLGN